LAPYGQRRGHVGEPDGDSDSPAPHPAPTLMALQPYWWHGDLPMDTRVERSRTADRLLPEPDDIDRSPSVAPPVGSCTRSDSHRVVAVPGSTRSAPGQVERPPLVGPGGRDGGPTVPPHDRNTIATLVTGIGSTNRRSGEFPRLLTGQPGSQCLPSTSSPRRRRQAAPRRTWTLGRVAPGVPGRASVPPESDQSEVTHG
jgi:hypothetical protein